MKANKTRHLIEVALRQILGIGDHLRSKSIMFAHEEASSNELEELERLAKIGEAMEFAVGKHYTTCFYSYVQPEFEVDYGWNCDKLIKWYEKNKERKGMDIDGEVKWDYDL